MSYLVKKYLKRSYPIHYRNNILAPRIAVIIATYWFNFINFFERKLRSFDPGVYFTHQINFVLIFYPRL